MIPYMIDRDCGVISDRGGKLTHGGNTNQRRAHAGIQASPQAIAGNALFHNVDCARVDASLGCL